MLINEVTDNLKNVIIPFWKRMKDEEYGGFFGKVDYDLKLYKRTSKYSVYNSRIMWFFLKTYKLTGDEECLECAVHAYRLMKNHCLDKTYGGLYWSMSYDCRPEDTSKYTFNMAYAILALSVYFEVTGDAEAVETAFELQRIIETRCHDEYGYLEAFNQRFEHFQDGPGVLSEGCYSGEKTANTVLHLLEAYTELYRVTKDKETMQNIKNLMKCFSQNIYNYSERHLNMFFDNEMRPKTDYFSFGHDIEAAWLIDRCCDIVPVNEYTNQMREISDGLLENIFQNCFSNNSIDDEVSNGKVVKERVFWVQAEAVVGFINAWQKKPERLDYYTAANQIWKFISEKLVDKRPGGEWLHDVSFMGEPDRKSAIAGEWKCPYHNGRMCIELIQRNEKTPFI